MSDPVVQPDSDAVTKARKRRNVWLAWALVAFVVIVGVSTAIRIQQTDFSGGDRLYFSGYLDEAEKEKADREAIARAQALAEEQTSPETEQGGASDDE